MLEEGEGNRVALLTAFGRYFVRFSFFIENDTRELEGIWHVVWDVRGV